jgi:replication factor A1
VKMKISEIRDGDRKVDLTAKVIKKSETREGTSKVSGEPFKVANATIEDESGTMTLTLWDEQVDQVRVGDRIKVENGYIRSFRADMQLNSGKYGTLTVL